MQELVAALLFHPGRLSQGRDAVIQAISKHRWAAPSLDEVLQKKSRKKMERDGKAMS